MGHLLLKVRLKYAQQTIRREFFPDIAFNFCHLRFSYFSFSLGDVFLSRLPSLRRAEDPLSESLKALLSIFDWSYCSHFKLLISLPCNERRSLFSRTEVNKFLTKGSVSFEVHFTSIASAFDVWKMGKSHPKAVSSKMSRNPDWVLRQLLMRSHDILYISWMIFRKLKDQLIEWLGSSY